MPRNVPTRRRPAVTTAAGVRPGQRGEVVFLADSFTSSTEPGIGADAIALLEHAGWQVRLESGACCARPQISKGLLGAARARGRQLVDVLAPEAERGVIITGCEPSCLSTLRDEQPRLLGDPRAAAVPTPSWQTRTRASGAWTSAYRCRSAVWLVTATSWQRAA